MRNTVAGFQTVIYQTLITENKNTSAKKYCEGLFNIFETVVEPARPCVSELKSIMLNNGASGAMMSGSGTSVFGIFDSLRKANDALEILRSIGAEAYTCFPI